MSATRPLETFLSLALRWYGFHAERFRGLRASVMLQIGTRSPHDLFADDALAGVLADGRIEESCRTRRVKG